MSHFEGEHLWERIKRFNNGRDPEIEKSTRIRPDGDGDLDERHGGGFCCGLVLCELEGIEDILLNRNYGLPEIKTEIRAIERAVFSPTFGLAEIKTEIKAIERVVLSPTLGLAEIKTEIKAIEGAIFSPTFGLAEIKTEIKAIERVILSPTLGLAEIKTEIKAIEGAIFSPTFGLAEIKTEIKEIIGMLEDGEACPNKTTGPVVADNLADRVVIKIFNNNLTARVVSATVYDLTTATKTVFYTTGNVAINPLSAVEFTSPNNMPANYEVEFTGLVSGVYGFTTTRQPGAAVQIIAANTFRHTELACLVSNP